MARMNTISPPRLTEGVDPGPTCPISYVATYGHDQQPIAWEVRLPRCDTCWVDSEGLYWPWHGSRYD